MYHKVVTAKQITPLALRSLPFYPNPFAILFEVGREGWGFGVGRKGAGGRGKAEVVPHHTATAIKTITIAATPTTATTATTANHCRCYSRCRAASIACGYNAGSPCARLCFWRQHSCDMLLALPHLHLLWCGRVCAGAAAKWERGRSG